MLRTRSQTHETTCCKFSFIQSLRTGTAKGWWHTSDQLWLLGGRWLERGIRVLSGWMEMFYIDLGGGYTGMTLGFVHFLVWKFISLKRENSTMTENLDSLGTNPRFVASQLCEFEQVTFPLCASQLWGLHELIHTGGLEEGRAQNGLFHRHHRRHHGRQCHRLPTVLLQYESITSLSPFLASVLTPWSYRLVNSSCSHS